jgi:S1-C subfamily serine protease
MKKIFYILSLLFVLGIAFADDTEEEVRVFEAFEESVVLIYQGLYFDAKTVSQPALFKKIEEKYDVRIIDTAVILLSGSGFFISKNGYIITNQHVVEAEDLVKIRKDFYENSINEFFSKIPRSILSYGEYDTVRKDFKQLVDKSKFYYGVLVNNKDNYVLKLLDSDRELDLALLKALESPDNFRPVFIGDSDELKVGQSVIAIGYPVPDAFATFKDFKSSLTTGSVSAIRSDAWAFSIRHP